MPKKPVSLTLERDNLLWLSGRVASGKRRSLSEALDEIITAARLGGRLLGSSRSVVGTIDIAADDPGLDHADEHVRAVFETSLGAPVLVREATSAFHSQKKRSRRG